MDFQAVGIPGRAQLGGGSPGFALWIFPVPGWKRCPVTSADPLSLSALGATGAKS